MATKLNKAVWLTGTTLALLFTVAVITNSVVASTNTVTHPQQLASSLGSQIQNAKSFAVGNPSSGQASASGSGPSQNLSPLCTVAYSDTIQLADPSQVGRLVTLTNPSSCASPRGCPGVSDSQTRHYRSYTFTNPNTGNTCVTVRLTPGNGATLVQSAAYMNSFNPTNPCENYLADIGPVPDILGGQYSFTVPAASTYVVVVSALLPGVGSLPYMIEVSSNPNCPLPVSVTSTPTPNAATQTAVAGTSTSVVGTLTAIAATQTAIALTASPTPNTCPTYSGTIQLSDPSQAGRLVSLTNPSSCASPRGCPGVADTAARHYRSYTFTNPNTGNTCVTIRLAPGNAGAAVQSATYLGSFNPLNPCENYLGDIGPVPSVSGSEYSVIVPAGATYVVVVSAFLPGVGSLPYTLNVISNPNCPLPVGGTPTSTPNAATQTSIAGTQTALAGTATVTSTPCTREFTDVPTNHTFYTYIRCLQCRSIISGYACGSPGEPCDANNNGYFRPYNNITRGQISKVVSNSAGFFEDPGSQIYTDVPATSTFYQWINRLSHRGFMGGYPCGLVPEEPCDNQNRPYFRWQANASRGQLSKIVSNAAGFSDTPVGQTFEDVPPGHPFYVWIERLTARGVMGGYTCGGVNPETGQSEPCVQPFNRPYFRPFNLVSRGQASKIVANTFFPDCYTPARP